jgi:hypothetical protein
MVGGFDGEKTLEVEAVGANRIRPFMVANLPLSLRV